MAITGKRRRSSSDPAGCPEREPGCRPAFGIEVVLPEALELTIEPPQLERLQLVAGEPFEHGIGIAAPRRNRSSGNSRWIEHNSGASAWLDSNLTDRTIGYKCISSGRRARPESSESVECHPHCQQPTNAPGLACHPPAQASPRQRDEPAREGELLRVAAGIFRTQRYDATSLTDIAHAFGITKASLYHYIDSKEDLLYRICRAAHDDALPVIEAGRVLRCIRHSYGSSTTCGRRWLSNARNVANIAVYYHDSIG